ncbi:hypothetical protein V7S43_015741 [Phytophthora oleae]|uniref:Uncharacterized protein n=1 Tax=Phytophthora oleae TaxID=2107226 RepID=A0ABD3EY83_9STRA
MTVAQAVPIAICEAPLDPEALAEAAVVLPVVLEAVVDEESVAAGDEPAVEVVAPASTVPVELEEPTVASTAAEPVTPSVESPAPEAPVAGAVVTADAAVVAVGVVLAADWPLTAAMAMVARTRTWTNFIGAGTLEELV